MTSKRSGASCQLIWWQPGPRLGFIPNVANLGDALSPFIVENSAARLGLGACQTEKRLLAIGSILHRASDGDIVWGTGHHGGKPLSAYDFKQLDVRAVRGPVTAELLKRKGIEAPQVFGDPAVLLPLYLSVPAIEKRSPFVLVPHYADRKRPRTSFPVVRTYGSDFARFVKNLAQAETVLSASLHGIIIAESYGIPSILVRNAQSETLHKYDDYYGSTGRLTYPVANSFEEAMRMSPPDLPDFHTMQQGLLNAFPKDLWQGTTT